jgi:CHAD domain-containing protein
MAKTKRVPGLDCSAPADKMIRLVLRSQLKTMCALREKALDWHDPEGVHAMRVLSRRLRSAMSDFKPFLRKASLPRLKLRSIAKGLGAVRDEDVALLALEELKSKAKGQAAEGIELLAEERRKRRKEARSALQKAIKRSAVDDFRKEFLAKLRVIAIVSPKKSNRKQANDMALAFGRVGIEVIEAALKELNAASSHIYFPFQIKELHEMRILAKRLRYAIELFASCWGEEMGKFAKEVSLLQTSLGELHDCDVWIESLGARLKQTARKGKSDEENALLREGAAWLVKHFARERMEHYRDALARWQQWEAEGFLQTLESILTRDIVSGKALDESSLLIKPSVTGP